MGNRKREFVIKDLMAPEFMVCEGRKVLLTETEESGKSRLQVQLMSEENLCIANIDKKKTEFHFFQEGKAKFLYKRVDHMIFERKKENRWKLHLIEMKGSVGQEKWVEIKGKFRASYLVAQALAGMLELNISETVMYTTYERVEFGHSDTMPAARHGRSGIPQVRMGEEWEGDRFGLNFGERISFAHVPVKMERDREGILTGFRELLL